MSGPYSFRQEQDLVASVTVAMDCQLTGRLSSKDKVAVTFACAVCGKEGLAQCLVMRGEKRSQITSFSCAGVHHWTKQQDLLVGWSAGR